MKKIFLVIAAIVIFSLCRRSQAATQPLSLGIVGVSVASMTALAISQSTAPAVGYIVYCGSCSSIQGGTICISTGNTVANQFILSTGTHCQ